MLRATVTASGGFLLGVLCMDLLFDIAILRIDTTNPHDAAALAAVNIISQYYAHAVLRAYPFNRLVAIMMLVTVLGSAFILYSSRTRTNVLALLLCLLPVLAGARVVQEAQQLGLATSSVETQWALARDICFFHIFCFASILAYLILRVLSAPRLPEKQKTA